MTSILDRQSIGKYKILDKIASGGQATVFQAFDQETGDVVALKVLDRNLADEGESRENFLRVARLAAQIKHPHVVEIFDVGEADGESYIAMELLSNNLSRVLSGSTRVPVQQAVEIARQVATGLEAARRSGVVHRDIKPSNILIRPRGVDTHTLVKLADFGISHAIEDAPVAPLMGTPHYISPEQGEGRPTDTRSDVYSLGVVIYRLLAGTVPFKAESPWDVIREHVQETPPPLPSNVPGITDELRQIVSRCMEKDPDLRFQTPAELALALGAIAIDTGSEVPGTVAGVHGPDSEETITIDLGEMSWGEEDTTRTPLKLSPIQSAGSPAYEALFNTVTIIGVAVSFVALVPLVTNFQIPLSNGIWAIVLGGGLVAAAISYIADYRALAAAEAAASGAPDSVTGGAEPRWPVTPDRIGLDSIHGGDMSAVSPLQLKRERVLTGLREAGSRDGLKAFRDIDIEHDQLHQLLIRKNATADPGIAQIPTAALRIYEEALTVLEQAAELMMGIQGSDDDLEAELASMTSRIEQMTGDETQDAQRAILEEARSILEGRIEVQKRQEIRVGQLINESRKCHATLSRSRAEVSSLNFEKNVSNVQSVIRDLNDTIRDVKETEAELREMGSDWATEKDV